MMNTKGGKRRTSNKGQRTKDKMSIVTVKDLTVMRGEYLAVENVSFELLLGTHTAIIGRNGAGKSTLIKTILGLIEAQSGEIKLFNSSGKQLERLK